MENTPNLTRRTMVRALLALSAACCTGAVAGCSGETDDAGAGSSDGSQDVETGSDAVDATDASTDTDSDDAYATGTHHIVIEVEDYGTIEATLNANVAPITVSNFCHLALDGFYDGLTFHRVIDDFMIQGGDPNGDGTGGSDETIVGEFSDNGYENNIPHLRGTISMARSSDYDSASSQFFIVQADSTYLDGSYAAFGTVSSGMDVVDTICEEVDVEDDNGTVAAENQPVITSITVID